MQDYEIENNVPSETEVKKTFNILSNKTKFDQVETVFAAAFVHFKVSFKVIKD